MNQLDEIEARIRAADAQMDYAPTKEYADHVSRQIEARESLRLAADRDLPYLLRVARAAETLERKLVGLEPDYQPETDFLRAALKGAKT